MEVGTARLPALSFSFISLGSPRFLPGLRCLSYGQGRDGLLPKHRRGGSSSLNMGDLLLILTLATTSPTGPTSALDSRFAVLTAPFLQVLTQFQEHPEAWTRVPDILERSTFPQAKVAFYCGLHSQTDPQKYIGLQILEKLITTRWKTLPDGQRQGPTSISDRDSLAETASRYQELYCRSHGQGSLG